MAVSVILACEAFYMIFARFDGTFFGTFILVGNHMSLDVLEGLATAGANASLFILGLVIAVILFSRRRSLLIYIYVGRARPFASQASRIHREEIVVDGKSISNSITRGHHEPRLIVKGLGEQGTGLQRH